MRKRTTVALFFAAACAVDSINASAATESAATYTGTNGYWSSPANWSTNPVVPIDGPAGIFDVSITSKNVTYNLAGSGQINTLQLASGSVSLNAGCNLSVLNGGAVTNSHIFVTGASFTDPESASQLVCTSLTAQNAGSLAFPDLTTFATNSSSSATFSASGTSSTISLPLLATIAEDGWGVTASASNGGDVELNDLSTVTYSGSIFENLTLQSTGTGSLVDVPIIGTNVLSRGSVSVGSGGTVNWGSPTAVHDSTLSLSPGGNLNTASLSDLTSTNLSVTGPATFSFPSLVTFTTDSNQSATFTASATGSKLSLPSLTTITETYWNVSLQAQSGGDIEAPQLANVNFTGSTFFENLTLNSTGNGSVINAPLLGSNPLSRLSVSVSTGGTLNWGSPTTVTDSNITLNTAGTLNTTTLSNLTSTSLTATSGATMTLPALTTFFTDSDESATFTASATGSKLSFPALTTITETYWNVSLQAQSGGDIEAPVLANINFTGNTFFENLTLNASGTGSVINAPQLGSNPLTRLSVDVSTGGNLNWGNPTTITDSSITLDTAGTLNTTTLSNLTSSNLTATNGVTMTLPALVTFFTDSDQSATFTASATGSKLLFPALTTITETYWNVSLQASNGGDIEAPQLASVNFTGNTFFQNLTLNASGTGSLIDVAMLGTSPVLTELKVTVSAGAAINWGSPKAVQSSNISVAGNGVLNTASITNLDSTTVTATGGAVLAFPLVTILATNSTGSATLTAQNASSAILLQNVTVLNEIEWGLTLTASAGGDVDLRNLSLVTNDGSIFENLTINSSNASSVVNLSSLDNTGTLGNTITIADNGSVLLGAGVGTRFLEFSADFANANGPLDIYVNGQLFDVIPPNNLNTAEGYEIPFASALTSPDVVDLISSGSGSSVTVKNYTAYVPEPASAALLATAGLMLGRRRRPRA